MATSLNLLDSRFRPLAEDLIAQYEASTRERLRIITTGRTPEEQAQALKNKTSWTKNSKHLPQPPEGKSLAIDLCPPQYLTIKEWNPTGALWWTLAEIAVSLGLRSGMDWNDKGLPRLGVVRPHWDPGHSEMRIVVPSLSDIQPIT